MVVDPEIHMLRNENSRGLSTDPEFICTGSNSGYQAMNIALLAGAARIVLVGYDAKPGPGGRAHWFGAHPDKTEAPYDCMRDVFKQAAGIVRAWKAPVEILNASPGSAIDCFPRVDLETVLA